MWPGVRLIEMRLRLKGLSDVMCKVVSVCCVSAVDNSANSVNIFYIDRQTGSENDLCPSVD